VTDRAAVAEPCGDAGMSDAIPSRAASRGFADPWSMGWYCTGCGPMGSTKDKRPMRVPDRTVRDGRYVFTCPVHGEIPVRWPNG
jgi:hypothetical protein